MKIDVFTPEDHVGDVIGDLNRRRGMIQGQEAGATGVRGRQLHHCLKCLATLVT